MIKLKLTHSRLTCLPEIIRNYMVQLCDVIDNCNYNGTTATTELLKVSIGSKLFENFNRKLLNRFPNKKYTLRLELHEAILVKEALHHHITTTANSYTRSISELIFTELDKNLINKHQLLTTNTNL